MHSQSAAARPNRWLAPEHSVAIVLIAAIALGGGGVAQGIMNLIVQLVAIAMLAIHREAVWEFCRSAPLSLRCLVGASIALPLLQLVPLPESIWQSLPGRQLAIEARHAVGISGWFPLSLAPHRTLVAVLGLIPPIALLAIGWRLKIAQLQRLKLLAIALGMFSVAIGSVQVTSQGTIGLLYPENPMPGVLFGTFANRNSAGLFLVVCLCFATSLDLRQFSPVQRVIALAVVGLILLAIVLTQSRSAMAVALLPLTLGIFRWFDAKLNLRRWAAVLTAALALIGITAIVTPNSRLETSFNRFAQVEDARSDIWPDAQYAARRYWPVGAGMGAFDEVFQVDESLEHMSMKRAGRAHNDYLEVAIEAGAPGMIIIAAWLCWIGWLSWQARLSQARWTAWGGSAALTAIALQSLIDYPLRNEGLLTVSALALLLLVLGAREVGR